MQGPNKWFSLRNQREGRVIYSAAVFPYGCTNIGKKQFLLQHFPLSDCLWQLCRGILPLLTQIIARDTCEANEKRHMWPFPLTEQICNSEEVTREKRNPWDTFVAALNHYCKFSISTVCLRWESDRRTQQNWVTHFYYRSQKLAVQGTSVVVRLEMKENKTILCETVRIVHFGLVFVSYAVVLVSYVLNFSFFFQSHQFHMYPGCFHFS